MLTEIQMKHMDALSADHQRELLLFLGLVEINTFLTEAFRGGYNFTDLHHVADVIAGADLVIRKARKEFDKTPVMGATMDALGLGEDGKPKPKKKRKQEGRQK